MSYTFQPLGTIISSALDYDNLCKITGDSNVIDLTKSSYVPCDGRSIAGSTLALKSTLTAAPDLRGRFIRGLNIIYSVGAPALDPGTADPNGLNRQVGDYQADVLLAHSHPASGHINGSVCGSNGTHDVDGGGDKWNSDPNFGDHNVVVTVGNSIGGTETRPRNVSTYFYLKIN